MGDSMGSGHGDGSFHRKEHSSDPGVDFEKFTCADRHRADLSGSREGGRQGRGSDLGDVPGHADRTSGTGGGLLHHPRRGAAAIYSSDGEANDRDREPWRIDHGQVVSSPSQGELPLDSLGRHLRYHGRV